MKTKLLILIAIMLLCGGCDLFQQNSETTIPEFNTGEDVAQAQSIVEKSTKEIKNATGDISEETQAIKKEIDQIKGKIPAELKAKINTHIDKINKSSDTISEKTQDINKSVAELNGANSLLNNAGKKITAIEKALDKITKERDAAILARDKAESDAKSSLHKALRWLIVGCILFAGVFAVLFVMHGSKFGLTGAAICAVVCAIAIFVEAYFIYVAIAGGLLLLGLIAMLVYQVVIRNRAIKETIDTVEVAKDNLDPAVKLKIFGGEGETGLMNSIQSRSTMDIVKREKGKMGSLWSYAKKKIKK